METLGIDIVEILEQNKEQMIKETTQIVLESFRHKLSYQYSDNVSKLVNEFFKEEIEPHVKQILLENKDEILNACADSAIVVASTLTHKITENAVKNMSQSYKMNAIVKALFD